MNIYFRKQCRVSFKVVQWESKAACLNLFFRKQRRVSFAVVQWGSRAFFCKYIFLKGSAGFHSKLSSDSPKLQAVQGFLQSCSVGVYNCFFAYIFFRKQRRVSFEVVQWGFKVASSLPADTTILVKKRKQLNSYLSRFLVIIAKS